MLRIPLDRPPEQRARWLIGLRWIILSLIALIILISNYLMDMMLPTGAIWATLVGIAAYNLIFWGLARKQNDQDASYGTHPALVRIQIMADLVALTLLLHFSGGIENPFSAYYLVLMVIGSIVLTKKDSLLFATSAALFWAGLLLLEAWGVIPHYNLIGFRLPVRYQQWSHIIAEILVLTTSGYTISYLTSSIIESLRAHEQQLYEANRACELRAGELAELNERLEAMDTTRSMFVRLVTHELRAPVAAIQSYLRLILDGYVPEERVEEIISKAEQRAKDQLDLIADLLDLAHLREPGHQMQAVPCDVGDVLADVLDMMQGRVENKQLHQAVEIEADLPPVMANQEHIKQIWTNLVSNAIKYTPEGGEIAISLRAEDQMLVGRVQDSGIGIAPKEQEHIFEDFYRTEKAKSMSPHGTGLGLAIVKGIVERYGGTIQLESEVDQGTLFTFTLPAGNSSPKYAQEQDP